MPSTKSVLIRTMVYAPTTGPGIASISAMNFGRNASTMKMAPMATPTARAATPVMSVMDTLDE